MSTIDKIAWIHLYEHRILSTLSRGKDVYYLPGGKRDPGESDLDTLIREIREELSVTIDPSTAHHIGTFTAQAHGHPTGTLVQLTCYTAAYTGVLNPDNEIESFTFLPYADRPRVSPADQLVFDHLHAQSHLK